jgi:hypothetical protein
MRRWDEGLFMLKLLLMLLLLLLLGASERTLFPSACSCRYGRWLPRYIPARGSLARHSGRSHHGVAVSLLLNPNHCIYRGEEAGFRGRGRGFEKGDKRGISFNPIDGFVRQGSGAAQGGGGGGANLVEASICCCCSRGLAEAPRCMVSGATASA